MDYDSSLMTLQINNKKLYIANNKKILHSKISTKKIVKNIYLLRLVQIITTKKE